MRRTTNLAAWQLSLDAPSAWHGLHRLGLDLRPQDAVEGLAIWSLQDIIKGTQPISLVYQSQQYIITLVQQASPHYTIDYQHFKALPQLLSVAQPHQCNHCTLTQGMRGFVLLLDEAFLKNNVLHSDKMDFITLEAVGQLALDPTDFETLQALGIALQQALGEVTKWDLKRSIVGSILSIFLHQIRRIWRSAPSRVVAERRGKTPEAFAIAQQFRILLQRYFQVAHQQVLAIPSNGYFSAQLHLSPTHFSRVIKQTTGRSPKQWITQKNLERSKTLLRHTNCSIQEIAFRTGFSSGTSFGKFFKKHTGQSPLTYRMAQN